jgi:dihydrofolate synthase/folylpolyglutamate synthase
MTYPETIKYLESFINYEKLAEYPYKESLKLKRVKDFLSSIGNPQLALRCVHVAGTKGKGSTCAFIAYILREAGFNVGLYTSPHLSDFRERIRILESQRVKGPKDQSPFEGMISRQRLAELVARLKPAIEKYNKISKYGPLSFFEVYTALAFAYFKEQGVDFVVLETGLGGRLDATNTASPLVCAITPISYEHTQKLGNTLTEIAQEKAGIIKKDITVISAPQEEEALSVICNRCKQTGARLYEARPRNLKTSLLGRHQLINSAVALEVVRVLRGLGVNINDAAIKNGLLNTRWPGRCEVAGKNPLIILDGAQNTASAKAIKEAVRESFKYKRLFLVLGVSKDKDIRGLCGELYDLADEVILTCADNPRACEPEFLAGYFAPKNNYLTHSVKEAKRLALRLAKKSDLILVTGSLFVVGEFRNA